MGTYLVISTLSAVPRQQCVVSNAPALPPAARLPLKRIHPFTPALRALVWLPGPVSEDAGCPLLYSLLPQEDATALPKDWAVVHAAAGLRCFLGVPISFENEITGMLTVAKEEEGALDDPWCA